MKDKQIQISNEQEKGKLGIAYLKHLWSSILLEKQGVINEGTHLKYNCVSAVFDALGIGIEPTYQFLYQEAPTFEAFEDWILKNGTVSKEMIELVNSAISSSKHLSTYNDNAPVLDDESLRHWDENGYVIIRDVITKDNCDASVKIIHEILQIDPNDKSTWYQHHSLKQGIMVQLFRNQQLDKNRFSTKIRQVYQQLWNRNDLIVSADRVSFNPPENENYKFPGPDLHWDVSLKQPIPFGLQGLLYLTDTPEDQGAFTLVPGFHRKIDAWLEDLPKNVSPRTYDLHQLGAKPIAANAGDFILWDHRLPHGSSPNTGKMPRIVQYINYLPLDRKLQTEWI